MYKEKYLKYKYKYIELKKQMGGLKGRRDFIIQVPEFINNTNPGYQNESPRNLNSITYADHEDYEYIKLKTAILSIFNKSKIDTSIPFLEDFINKLNNFPQEILTIIGFYNVNKKYDIRENCGTLSAEDCGLDVGTVVKQQDMVRIFNPNSQLQKDFIVSKGKGKINLNLFCKEMKNTNIKYLMLDAAGKIDLRGLYEKYGFKTLMVDYYVNMFDNQWFPTIDNSIMIGSIDEIIAATN